MAYSRAHTSAKDIFTTSTGLFFDSVQLFSLGNKLKLIGVPLQICFSQPKVV